MRLCTDCTHHILRDVSHLCTHPHVRTDPVTGRDHAPACAAMRVAGAPCGPEGRLFAARTADAAMRPPEPDVPQPVRHDDGSTTLGPILTKG